MLYIELWSILLYQILLGSDVIKEEYIVSNLKSWKSEDTQQETPGKPLKEYKPEMVVAARIKRSDCAQCVFGIWGHGLGIKVV